MKKIIVAMTLCVSFLLIPGIPILANTEASVNTTQHGEASVNEVPIEENQELVKYNNEKSSEYLQDFKKLDKWNGWILLGATLPYFLPFAVFAGMLSFKKNVASVKHIILIVCVGVFALVIFTAKLNDELNHREIRYKAALIQEIADAYIEEHGTPPITGKFIGAGEKNLLYPLNLEEMIDYELAIANLDLNGYYLEDITGNVYTGSHGEFVKYDFNQ